MRTLLRGAQVFQDGRFTNSDLLLSGNKIIQVGAFILPAKGDRIFDFQNCFIVPGLVDVHVHLREPGFFYKETIKTGTEAAARGGYTCVFSMPNLDPAPDCQSSLARQLALIERDARVRVLPYGLITKGQNGEFLADYASLAPFVCGFSDDGRGVQDEDVMRSAMRAIAQTGKILAAHCEVNALLRGGYIHDGTYAREHGHLGICAQSEWQEVERDIRLARETGCPLHICHVSCKESVRLIRAAKSDGVNISCETAPHYLLLTQDDLQEDGRFKMNPPLRAAEDRSALLEGLRDGTIDMIATDHAPHSPEEKSRGLAGSLMGVVGLESAFQVLYTGLVDRGLLTLATLVNLMSLAPRRRFALDCGKIAPGEAADLTVLDLESVGSIDPESFASKGRATPFAGQAVKGKIKATIYGGEFVWQSTN